MKYMKIEIYLFLSVCFTFSVPTFVTAQDTSFKLNSYDVTLKLNPDSMVLDISSVIEFEKFGTTNEIMLLKSPYLTYRSFNIKSVLSNRDINYEMIGNDTLKIILPPDPAAVNKYYFQFDYSLNADTLSNGSILLYEGFPYIKNNIPSWKFRFNIPAGYTVFLPSGVKYTSPGSVQETNNIVNIIYPIPRMTILLAKPGSYSHYNENLNESVIDYYFSSTDANVINKIISETKNSFLYYNDLLGKCAYEHINFIEVPGEQYINSQPGMVLIGSLFIDHFNDGFNEWMAHETAHQWIGAGVHARYGERGNSCIFEPIAEYLKMMYLENKYGKDTLNSRLKNIFDEYSSSIYQTEKDVPVIDGGGKRVVYLKGPLIMHKLRNLMGDEYWIQLLKNIYRNYKGTFFTYVDFYTYLNAFDLHGILLNKFQEWMEHPGLPE